MIWSSGKFGLIEKVRNQEEEKIVIGPTLNLETSDIHDLNKKLNLQPDPILDGIEVLS